MNSISNSVFPGTLKERQRQERVELILKTAEDVLAEKSYHEMSMDEIAARVGIAKGTIYLHFPSKEDLVIALIKKSLTNYLEGVVQVAAQPCSARERLQLILTQSFSEQHKKQTQLFMSIFSGGSIRHENVEKHFSVRDYKAQLATPIKQIMEDGKAAGEFDPSIPTIVMLSAFLALLNRRYYEELLGENLLSPQELAEQLARVFFQGISRP